MSLSMSMLVMLLGPVSSADALIELQTDGVRLRVPAAWEKRVEGQSYEFSAPSEDARFEFSVMKVEPKRSASKCFDELMVALGKGWEKTRTGRRPAAKITSVEKSEKVVVETRGFVGCDGSRKWVLTWAYNQEKQARFSALVKYF